MNADAAHAFACRIGDRAALDVQRAVAPDVNAGRVRTLYVQFAAAPAVFQRQRVRRGSLIVTTVNENTDGIRLSSRISRVVIIILDISAFRIRDRQRKAVQIQGDGAGDVQRFACSNGNVLCQLDHLHRVVFHSGKELILCGDLDLCRQVQKKRGFLWDVVIRQRAVILQLLTVKGELLLMRRDAFLIMNFLLHIVNSVAGFHLRREGSLARQLDKNLHGARARAHA